MLLKAAESLERSVRFQYLLERLELGTVEESSQDDCEFKKAKRKWKSLEIILKKISAIFYLNRGPQVMTKERNCGTNLAEM